MLKGTIFSKPLFNSTGCTGHSKTIRLWEAGKTTTIEEAPDNWTFQIPNWSDSNAEGDNLFKTPFQILRLAQATLRLFVCERVARQKVFLRVRSWALEMPGTRLVCFASFPCRNCLDFSIRMLEVLEGNLRGSVKLPPSKRCLTTSNN